MAHEWIFVEQQKFRQWWVWLLILGIAFLVGSRIINQGRNDIPTILMFFAFVLGLPLLFLVLKLRTKVSAAEVELEFVPVWTRTIPTEQIESAEAVKYRPLRDAAGWGIHYSPWLKGWAYNVRGSHGVRLELTGGKRVLVGSQRSDELAAAINSVIGVPEDA